MHVERGGFIKESWKIIGMDVKSVRKQRKKKKSLLYRSEYVDFWDVITTVRKGPVMWISFCPFFICHWICVF